MAPWNSQASTEMVSGSSRSAPGVRRKTGTGNSWRSWKSICLRLLRARSVAFGPEVGKHPVAAESLIAGQADEGEQGQRPLSGYGPRQRPILVFYSETAEGPEAQHRAGRSGFLTGI